MRALAELLTTSLPQMTILESIDSGTYQVDVGIGLYRAVLIGGGGGAATAGYPTSESKYPTAQGIWTYGCGGGGGAAVATFRVRKTTTATIVVGESGVGTQETATFPEYPSQPVLGTGGDAINTTLDCGGVSIVVGGGKGGSAAVPNAQKPIGIGGAGGSVVSIVGCESAEQYDGTAGDACGENYLSEVTTTSVTLSGGAAEYSVPVYIAAGRGGGVTHQITSVSASKPRVAGGNGAYAYVRLERIG